MKVYYKEEIPQGLHYQQSDRIGQLKKKVILCKKVL
jgi:hypothetical protein